MVELRKFWKDVKKSCNENESCSTCKYVDFNPEVCAFRRVTSIELEWIENMFSEGAIGNEH